ncbi:GatB/YqeY domain-containing protein [Desulforhopalus vacuolatus]|uniref:GatB/YqeY domain-containing protein n=1 Tax=Desulforhopalus vacuolatus TaxID=40414 RepID=UPI0019625969|nr:GatB/YqeY domain-containing protein [Desulforhopalus vacuolatus]MBM9518485.1 GatB/YqeY domain-containing protein [Desulforhopalus vacuolatus]
MSLQEDLKVDLKNAMKARETEKVSAVRILIGEFARQREKELSDEQVIAIVKKLIKSEKELLEAKGEKDASSPYITIMESYLPQQASEQDIKAWIDAHVNLADFGNKMQAMKPIMQHFGARVDGNTVKKVLGSL